MSGYAFVQVVQVSRNEAPWLKPTERTFYRPVRDDEPWLDGQRNVRGGLSSLLPEGRMPTVWGFLTLDEAQRVVKAVTDPGDDTTAISAIGKTPL